MPSSRDADVIVVGAGNAGFCAALAAAERGARVLMLEKAPDDWLGGNSYFTAGAIRSVHAGLEDVLSLVEPIDRARAEATDLEPYGADDFREDMRRLTESRADPELAELLIGDSRQTLGWLADQGVPLRLMYDRQSYAVDGRHVFWGGLHVGTVDGGRGLIEHERRAAANAGVELRTGHAVTGLIQHRDAVEGVRCRAGSAARELEITAPAVVIAAGGFEADPRRRAMYLGPNWDVAKVRGTPHNTGEALEAMLALGALPYGHWSGCHSIAWDAGAPATGDRVLTNRLSRQSYPLGLVVNRDGERFVDEGADFRNYTYARYGAEILSQPGSVAFQLFDSQTERFERKHLIVASSLVMGALGITFGFARAPWLIVAAGFLLTATSNVFSNSFHIYQAEIFPTRIRATAVGAAYSLSRLSGAILPFISVSVLDHLGASTVFIGSAAIMALIATDVALLGPRSTGLKLEDSSDDAAAVTRDTRSRARRTRMTPITQR